MPQSVKVYTGISQNYHYYNAKIILYLRNLFTTMLQASPCHPGTGQGIAANALCRYDRIYNY